MNERTVKIGLVQTCTVDEPRENIKSAIAAIEDLADHGAQIICLSELFATHYFCHSEDHTNFALAEPVPGPTVVALQDVARRKRAVIIAPLFEKAMSGLYFNTVAVIDADGSYLGKYRKTHIPDDPGFYEKFYFAPGDTGYRVFDTRYARIGVLICWDQWFPEAARLTALKGADIIFYPTAIGWDVNEPSATVNNEQVEAWQTIQRSHAIANGVYVVSVNRIGTYEGTRFWGTSFVANPFGSVVWQAPHEAPAMHVETLDLSLIEHYRTVWPFLRDRRVDTYQQITSLTC